MKQLIYINIQEKKEIILKELKNKAGIYLAKQVAASVFT